MGQPAFIFGSYSPLAAVTANSSKAGFSANDILGATEDVGHTPATSGDVVYTIDCSSARGVDVLAVLGEGFDGLLCSIEGSSDGSAWVPMEINQATNGAFASDTGWTKGTGWTIASGIASSDASQTGNSDLAQGALTAGKRYLVQYTVSGRTAGTITAVCGGQAGVVCSSNATFTETIVCDADGTFKLRANLDFDGDVDNVSYAELLPLSLDLNAAWRSCVAGSYRYFRLTLYGAPSSLLINHLCLDTLAAWPYLEEDWDGSGVVVEGEYQISAAGYFAGGTAQKAERKMPIVPGVVTSAEFPTLQAFAAEVIRPMAGCFFVPDVAASAVYFGCIEGKSFAAPFKNGAHEVQSMVFIARAA
jgi:hypothetical protein